MHFIARAVLGAALFAVPATAQVDDLARKFGEREAFDGVALSPDGTRISYLNPVAGKGTALVVVDIKTSATKAVLSTGDPTLRLSWCYWVKNDRLACSIRGERQAIGETHGVSRIVAVDADGGNIKELGSRPSRRSIGLNAYGGSIIDHLADDPDNILMMVYKLPEESVGTLIADTEGGLTVARVNARSGRTQHIESPAQRRQLRQRRPGQRPAQDHRQYPGRRERRHLCRRPPPLVCAPQGKPQLGAGRADRSQRQQLA